MGGLFGNLFKDSGIEQLAPIAGGILGIMNPTLGGAMGAGLGGLFGDMASSTGGQAQMRQPTPQEIEMQELQNQLLQMQMGYMDPMLQAQLPAAQYQLALQTGVGLTPGSGYGSQGYQAPPWQTPGGLTTPPSTGPPATQPGPAPAQLPAPAPAPTAAAKPTIALKGGMSESDLLKHVQETYGVGAAEAKKMTRGMVQQPRLGGGAGKVLGTTKSLTRNMEKLANRQGWTKQTTKPEGGDEQMAMGLGVPAGQREPGKKYQMGIPGGQQPQAGAGGFQPGGGYSATMRGGAGGGGLPTGAGWTPPAERQPGMMYTMGMGAPTQGLQAQQPPPGLAPGGFPGAATGQPQAPGGGLGLGGMQAPQAQTMIPQYGQGSLGGIQDWQGMLGGQGGLMGLDAQQQMAQQLAQIGLTPQQYSLTSGQLGMEQRLLPGQEQMRGAQMDLGTGQAQMQTGLLGAQAGALGSGYGLQQGQNLMESGLLSYEDALRRTQMGTETGLVGQRGGLESAQIGASQGLIPGRQQLTQNLLTGGQLPGQFGQIGQSYGQDPNVQTALNQAMQTMQNQRGLTPQNFGGMGDVLGRQAGLIGAENAARQRQENLQLMQTGLGSRGF